MSTRTRIGITALVLLAIGALQVIGAVHDGLAAAAMGSCIRIGTILAAIWLAWPDLGRPPNWITPALVVVAVAVLFRSPWLMAAAPVVGALGWLLRPRNAARK